MWPIQGWRCHLLGIETAAELEKSPFLGVLFEGFIAAELVKAQVHAGKRRELYYFRDQQGLEVDFVQPIVGGIRLIEAKATRTPMPNMAAPMRRVAQSFAARAAPRRRVEMLLVHRPPRHAAGSRALPGVQALSWQELLT